MAKRPRRKRQINPSLLELPRNVRLAVEPDRLEIVYTNKRWIMGAFDAGFALIWTFFLIQILSEAFQRGMPTSDIIGLSLFSLVLLFLFSVALRCFFHKEKLRIDENGIDWRLSCLLPLRNKKVSWNDLVAINAGMGSGDERQLIRGWGVEVETNAKAFLIFLDMPYWTTGKTLQHVLQCFVDDYRSRHSMPVPEALPKKNRRRGSLQMTKTPDALEIQGVPYVDWTERGFWAVWFLGWTSMCVVFTCVALIFEYDTPQGPIWFRLLIVILLWTVWAFVSCAMFGKNFRLERLRVNTEGLEYQQEVLIPFFPLRITLKNRCFTLSEIALAEVFYTPMEMGIELPTSGKPLRCFRHDRRGGGDPEVFLEPLNEYLKGFGVKEKIQGGKNTREKADTEMPDNRWLLVDDGITQTFSRRGWIPLSQFISILFICFFWNTILSLFVSVGIIGLFDEKALGFSSLLLCILVPFILIGIWLLLGTFYIATQYLCMYTVVLDVNGIRYRRCRFAIGRERHFPWNRIEKTIIVRNRIKNK